MAVNENALVLLVVTAHVLADDQYQIVVRAREIFPTPIVRCDSVLLQMLWIVAEAHFSNNAIPAECMLARLLQVDDHANLQAVEKITMMNTNFRKKSKDFYLL